jgi:4,5-dihydroxyphthalate decarboxylase
MGDDYWPYGVGKNRTAIDAAINYSYEQGMISRRLEIEELFAKSTLEEFVI